MALDSLTVKRKRWICFRGKYYLLGGCHCRKRNLQRILMVSDLISYMSPDQDLLVTFKRVNRTDNLLYFFIVYDNLIGEPLQHTQSQH